MASCTLKSCKKNLAIPFSKSKTLFTFLVDPSVHASLGACSLVCSILWPLPRPRPPTFLVPLTIDRYWSKLSQGWTWKRIPRQNHVTQRISFTSGQGTCKEDVERALLASNFAERKSSSGSMCRSRDVSLCHAPTFTTRAKKLVSIPGMGYLIWNYWVENSSPTTIISSYYSSNNTSVIINL